MVKNASELPQLPQSYPKVTPIMVWLPQLPQFYTSFLEKKNKEKVINNENIKKYKIQRKG
jgi:hypothetical protein